MLKKIIISTLAAISLISSPVVFSAENSDAAAQHKKAETRENHQSSQDATEKKEAGSEKVMKQKRDGADKENANEASTQERKFGPKG